MTAPPGLDPARLAGYLAGQRPELAAPPLSATLIAGGRSNLTYVVRSADREYVLRRPPLGHVLATAHDMAREFRVISALAGTDVPVPQTFLLCTDPDVLGAPFYLMSRVPGVIYRSRAQTDALTGAQRQRLAETMMDTLAVLHGVEPDEVGLGDFGRPDGYLQRQVRRWAQQLDRSHSRDLPGADELRDRLAATVPPSRRARIVHGDYRLDNLMVDPARMEIAAVLDWEMATLGDPLADLGLLLVYWNALGGSAPSDRPGLRASTASIAAGNPVADGLGPAAGFPSGDELVARYVHSGGVAPERLDWYIALGAYKLAVICEGIHYRFTLGQTVGEGFDRMGALVAPLIANGLAALSTVEA